MRFTILQFFILLILGFYFFSYKPTLFFQHIKTIFKNILK